MAHVKEAFALLRQSIIHVEQDDIELDEEPQQAPGNEASSTSAGDSMMEDMTSDSLGSDMQSMQGQPGQVQGLPMSAVQAATTGSGKKKLMITYEKYMSVMNMVVLYLAEFERSGTRGVEAEALIQWYLEQKEEDLETEADFVMEQELIRKILKKLTKVRLAWQLRATLSYEI